MRLKADCKAQNVRECSRKYLVVMPTKAGIQNFLGPRFRRGDLYRGYLAGAASFTASG